MAFHHGGRKQAVMACHMIVALICVLASCIELSEAASVVDVYRMIQYDLSGSAYGSRRSGLNHHASSGAEVAGSDLTRAVIVMPVDNVNLPLINEVLQGNRFIGGLLLILPTSKDGSDADEDADADAARWRAAMEALASLEQLLLHSSIPVPVYFAEENETLKKMFREVQASDAAGTPATATNGGYKLVVTAGEPKKLPVVPLSNIQGWLHGLRAEGEGANLPTLAITASYDAFGAAPGLARGADVSASGVVVLLEVARLFSRLYASQKTRGRFNILFALTAGGPFNFDGTKQWLAGFDQRVLETVDFALCLNALGGWGDQSGEQKLHLHVSKPPKDPSVKRFHEGLDAVAAEQGFSVELVHKKINMSDSRVAWEHEQFSRHRIVAGTLSHLSNPPDLFQSAGGAADQIQLVNQASVMKSAKLVAETLGRLIYGHEGKTVDIFAAGSSLAVSAPFIAHWTGHLARTPRAAPFLSKTHPVIEALLKELGGHTDSIELRTVPLDSSFAFYDVPPVSQLEIYKVASVTFDLLIMLAIGAYLGSLYLILHISTKGLDDLMGVFRKPLPRGKSKSL